MSSLPVDGPPDTATARSRSHYAGVLIASLVGLTGALIAYEAALNIEQCAVCAASRSPLTVGLYVAIASALAAWTLTSQRRSPAPRPPAR